MRWSLAAMASLGACGSAPAGTIDGSVVFPAGAVPALTVYAAAVDGSALHTLALERGRSTFSIEVPGGVYSVFLAPDEPGAPLIYGAYTTYSRCTPHDVEGQCEDHALAQVVVPAKGAHTAVVVDDWYLTDDTILALDRLRGAPPDTQSFGGEPLSAPRFSEYPSAAFEPLSAAKIDLTANGWSQEQREGVRQALAKGPNFAGSLTAAWIPCGPQCSRLVLVDWRSGRVSEPVPPDQLQGALPCRSSEAVRYRRDSRLLSLTRTRGSSVVTEYYVWNQSAAKLVQGGAYQRPTRAFCPIAAR